MPTPPPLGVKPTQRTTGATWSQFAAQLAHGRTLGIEEVAQTTSQALFLIQDAVDRLRAALAELSGSVPSSVVPNPDTSVTINGVPVSGASQSTSNFKGDHVSVRDFGAIGDGSTVDTAAIQTAIAIAISLGLSVLIPDGVFVTGPLSVAAPIDIYGNGTLLLDPAAGFASSMVLVTSDGVRISDITIDGNSTNRPGTSQDNGVVFSGCDGVSLNRVIVQNMSAVPLGPSGGDAVITFNATHVDIFDCQLDAGRNCVSVVDGSQFVTIRGCTLSVNDATGHAPIDIEPFTPGAVVSQIRIIDNDISGGHYSIVIYQTPGSTVEHIWFEDNTLNGWTSLNVLSDAFPAVLIYDASHVSVKNNTFTDPVSPSQQLAMLIKGTTVSPTFIEIAGNTVTNLGSYAAIGCIEIQGVWTGDRCLQVSVHDNVVTEVTGGGTSLHAIYCNDLNVSNNTVTASTGQGILIETSDYVEVIGNEADGCTANGLLFAGNDRTVIMGNSSTNNLVGLNVASGTNYTIHSNNLVGNSSVDSYFDVSATVQHFATVPIIVGNTTLLPFSGVETSGIKSTAGIWNGVGATDVLWKPTPSAWLARLGDDSDYCDFHVRGEVVHGTLYITPLDTGTVAYLAIAVGGAVYRAPDPMVNPMTALGDIISGGAAGAPARLAGNTTTTRQFYASTGAAGVATAPVLVVLATGDIPAAVRAPVTQTDVTASRAIGTVYHNTGTTPMMCTVTVNFGGGGGTAAARTDAAATPTTNVAFANDSIAVGISPITFWVLPGNYYTVAQSAGSVLLTTWIEWN